MRSAALALMLAAGCAPVTDRNPVAITGERPHLELQADKLQPGLLERVTVRAFLRGEPLVGRSEWQCITEEWWIEGGAHKVTGPQPDEPCGELGITRSFSRTFQFESPGVNRVFLTLWDRSGHRIDTRFAQVDVRGGE